MFNPFVSFTHNSHTVEWLEGNCLTVLKTLPDKCIQCCVTSPPYFNLRNYDHPDQIGRETTPAAFVESLKKVFHEVKRVMKDNGILYLNLGDSYSSRKAHGLKPKDLIGIPWQVAFALRDNGWYLRQDTIWYKTNPMPESVKTRCTLAHEYVFLFAKSEQYLYNNNAIAEPADPSKWGLNKINTYTGKDVKDYNSANVQKPSGIKQRLAAKLASGETITRNAHSVWPITKPAYRGDHFAVMPKALAERCILVGSNKGDWILDPFGGAGTTGLASLMNERNCLLIELNNDYILSAKHRFESVFSNKSSSTKMSTVDELFDFGVSSPNKA